jgi:hemerythrin
MFEWDDKYSVGISIIDKEHKELFCLINKTFYVDGHGDSKLALMKIIEQMTDYAIKHFKAEEAYMREFNYSEYQDHSEEHRDFTTEIIAYHDKVIKGDFQIANEIIEYLKWWLVNHIQVTDKKYIDCFKENGLK